MRYCHQPLHWSCRGGALRAARGQHLRLWFGAHAASRARRRPVVINLDPANDELPYPCALDIADLITCSDVMDAMDLGPNGGLMYCMDFLAENMSWLDERIHAIQRESSGGKPCAVSAFCSHCWPASAAPRGRSQLDVDRSPPPTPPCCRRCRLKA